MAAALVKTMTRHHLSMSTHVCVEQKAQLLLAVCLWMGVSVSEFSCTVGGI